jgi:hypothetical protein
MSQEGDTQVALNHCGGPQLEQVLAVGRQGLIRTQRHKLIGRGGRVRKLDDLRHASLFKHYLQHGVMDEKKKEDWGVVL